MQQPWQPYVDQARKIHRRHAVLDSHCDTTQRLMDPAWDFLARHDDGHVDVPRMRDGGLDTLFLAVWTPGPLPSGEAVPIARKQIARIRKVVAAHPESLTLAMGADDVRAAHAAGKVAILLCLEGGYMIEDSVDVLREFAAAGAQYMTLTHSFHTNWCDSSGVHEALPPKHGGLTDFGRDMIREMNRLGVMVDVSHVSTEAVYQTIEVSAAPVIASHSSCGAVCDHIRNLDDNQIRAIAATGGVVQVNFAALFVDPSFPTIDKHRLKNWMRDERLRNELRAHVTPLSVLADHVDHVVQLVGPQHAGLGSDFDGVPQLPESLSDCCQLPNLTAELLRRGYDEDALRLILGENMLRVMDECRRVARSITQESGPDGRKVDATAG